MTTVDKPVLFGRKPAELLEITTMLGLPGYVAKQLAAWLYQKDITSFNGMTDLSKKTREVLAEAYDMGLTPPSKVVLSRDGTRKYLFPVSGGRYVESALIPDGRRASLCLSTQVGCRMGCVFCMTGRQGFQGNLSAGEILNQVRSLPERNSLTNIIYMGMGEPLDNLEAVLASLEILTSARGFGMSHQRVTVSTVGIVPAMKEFFEKSDCHLAVSLHSPVEEERRKLMPVEHAYPLREVIKTIREAGLPRQRRVSFEYIMFRGLNDTPAHIREIVRLLSGLRCRVNLIRFHPIPGSALMPSEAKTMEKFMIGLNEKGIRTTVRKSRGEDIQAACGLLSTGENVPAKR
jgi:23S rRNA (adenine2503-C2)-methyltransferase